MGRKDKFDYFKAFERLAHAGLKESSKLVEILQDYDHKKIKDYVESMHKIEHTADSIVHDVYQELTTEFIAPIEREDIIELTHYLDDINDYIDSAVQHLYMFDIREINEDALAMAKLIHKTCKLMCEAMEEFGNFKKSKKIKQAIIKVSDAEDDADKLYLEATRRLYTKHTKDPLYCISWTQIFTRLERCCDACESASDVMGTIILKNT